MNQKFCQCCGMPMDSQELYGLEVDGTQSEDYCKYCYEKGKFTFNGSLAEMIEICVPHMVGNNPSISPEQARQMMEQFMPSLKRWKKS